MVAVKNTKVTKVKTSAKAKANVKFRCVICNEIITFGEMTCSKQACIKKFEEYKKSLSKQ